MYQGILDSCEPPQSMEAILLARGIPYDSIQSRENTARSRNYKKFNSDGKICQCRKLI